MTSPEHPPTHGHDPDATHAIGRRPDQPTTPHALHSGRTLGARYEVGEVIGRGGMAEVHRALDTRLGRGVAIKELRADLASDPTFQARFRREAQSAAGLNHPHIVAVYDTGEEIDPRSGRGIPYIVMELVEGETLRAILRDGHKIMPERALEITQGVLDALGYSHRSGIIHRDIKPANVMLTTQGHVKVMDFGIARAVADTSATMTQTAAVIGTAQYLSPEQARGEKVDSRSDLYSAGCLLYELLTGRPPFMGDSPVSVAYQHVREIPVPPSTHNPEISPDIDAITMRALAKKPDDRYQSARDMSEDIARVLAGRPARAAYAEPTMAMAQVPPSPLAPRTPTPMSANEYEQEPRRRRGALPILLVTLALLVVGMIVAGLWFLNSKPAPPAPSAPAMVSVPSVLRANESSATKTLADSGLKAQVQKVAGPAGETVNTVTSQDPAAGQQVAPGSTVTIRINQGPDRLTVPELVGRDKDDAIKILKDAGFTNVNAQEAGTVIGSPNPDSVLQVDPGAGQQVTPDTKVTLYYAPGRLRVPNWIGDTRNAVERDARSQGLTNVVFSERETSDSRQVGNVIATDPSAGTSVNRNDRIQVLLGKAAPAPTPPPASFSATQPAQPTPTAPQTTPPAPTTGPT